jgi:hypothetical protein
MGTKEGGSPITMTAEILYKVKLEKEIKAASPETALRYMLYLIREEAMIGKVERIDRPEEHHFRLQAGNIEE